LLPEVPCHVTQRGVDRRETFSSDEDRETFLRLLRENRDDAAVRVLGWCLMTNHVHLVLLPGRKDSVSVLMRRVHGRYAQYYNVRWGRTGHLWQNRFYGCMLGPAHLWTAVAYVDRNPVRAGMVETATQYRWSSARAHVSGNDADAILDMEWWERERRLWRLNWETYLLEEDGDGASALRACTYAGRPFADEEMVNELGKRFHRTWTRGRPKKRERSPADATSPDNDQFVLFEK
jgi:putative transposase